MSKKNTESLADRISELDKMPVTTKVDFAFEGGESALLTMFGANFEHCKLKFIVMGTECVYVVKGVYSFIVDEAGNSGWVRT